MRLLTEHGHFHFYLFKMNKMDRPERDDCPDVADNAEHMFFRCPRWQKQRDRVERRRLSKTYAHAMLTSIINSMAIDRNFQDALRRKKANERERENTHNRGRRSDEEYAGA